MSGSDSPTFFHGQPWSSWIEKIGRDKPLSDDEADAEPASSVMRLSVDDIDLYGFCPERDSFYGVVCEICNSVIKPQALIQHMESRHPSGNPNVTPSTNSTNSTNSTAASSAAAKAAAMKTPYCKISKLKKSQSSGQLSVNSNNTNSNSSKTSNNHTPVKQRAVGEHASSSPRSPHESSSLPCTQTTLAGSQNGGSPVKSPGNQPKRKRLKAERSLLKDREYDPDRHCGVWIEETGKPCTRSLTCKAHTVSLRRTVSGRSKPFDKLLADHRASKEPQNTKNTSTVAAKQQVASTAASTSSATTVTGTISIATSASELPTASALTPSTPIAATGSATGVEAPKSPPVLSLPDTFTLPKAVDMLYVRCLDQHGSNKPTKLEEDFANQVEGNGRSEPPKVKSENITGKTVAPISINSSINASGVPMSVALPSLSPIQTGSMSPQPSLLQYSSRNVNSNSPMSVEQLMNNKQSPASAPVVPPTLPVSSQQPVLEAKTAPMDIDNSQNITMYTSSPMGSKSQVTMQIGPSSRSSFLFEDYQTMDKSHSLVNDKHMSNHLLGSRAKLEFPSQDYSQIQLEATTAPTPFTNFDDITWSNCHPEPLEVTRWLRINSSRKQYNFNIH